MRFLFYFLFLSFTVFPIETKEEREVYFKQAFGELEIFYQDFKKKYVREKKVDEKLLPLNFPEEIKITLRTRSIEDLKNLGKDEKSGRKDMELYLSIYFERILSRELVPFHKRNIFNVKK